MVGDTPHLPPDGLKEGTGTTPAGRIGVWREEIPERINRIKRGHSEKYERLTEIHQPRGVAARARRPARRARPGRGRERRTAQAPGRIRPEPRRPLPALRKGRIQAKTGREHPGCST